MRQFILATAAVGLLFFGEGCSALLLRAASQGDETPFQVALGSMRDDVEAKLGRPVTARPLPDGGQVAIYEYRLPDEGARKAAELALRLYLLPFAVGGHPVGALMLSTLSDSLFMPYALYKVATARVLRDRGRVTFTYGPDGRLLYGGLPPPYGAPDDAVEPPSVGAIRRSCWSQGQAELPDSSAGGGEKVAAEDYLYVGCVSRGFAIWGIE